MAIFFVYFMWIIGFISIMNNKKHDCYIVLKDSTGLTHHVYGFFHEEKTDYSGCKTPKPSGGRKWRGVYIEGILHYFPAADVVVFGNLV